MKVKLISHTPQPEAVCARAAKGDTDIRPSHKITDYDEGGWEGILKFCIQHGHHGVLEHASFTFSIEGVSRACSHQLVRHRIATFDQQSQRYVDFTSLLDPTSKSYDVALAAVTSAMRETGELPTDPDPVKTIEAYFVFPPTIRRKPETARALSKTYVKSVGEYAALVKSGVPPEDARFVFPNGMKTNLTATLNYRAIYDIAAERLCTRAQWEIRVLFSLMKREIRQVAPFLGERLQPKCIHLGYCNEAKKAWATCQLMPHMSTVLGPSPSAGPPPVTPAPPTPVTR
ncbi:MAG: FAD-dependent thymidylate synthase [Candidatus Rokuibacteriota bacterium]